MNLANNLQLTITSCVNEFHMNHADIITMCPIIFGDTAQYVN